MFTAKRKLQSVNQKMQNGRQIETPKQTWLAFQKPCRLQSPETKKKQYGHQVAILKMTLLKIIGSYPYT